MHFWLEPLPGGQHPSDCGVLSKRGISASAGHVLRRSCHLCIDACFLLSCSWCCPTRTRARCTVWTGPASWTWLAATGSLSGRTRRSRSARPWSRATEKYEGIRALILGCIPKLSTHCVTRRANANAIVGGSGAALEVEKSRDRGVRRLGERFIRGIPRRTGFDYEDARRKRCVSHPGTGFAI